MSVNNAKHRLFNQLELKQIMLIIQAVYILLTLYHNATDRGRPNHYSHQQWCRQDLVQVGAENGIKIMQVACIK